MANVRLTADSKTGGKFWEITRDGSKTSVVFGALNGSSQQRHKIHASAEAAEKYVNAQVKSKKKKGYTLGGEVSGSATKKRKTPSGGKDKGKVANKKAKTSGAIRTKITSGERLITLKSFNDLMKHNCVSQLKIVAEKAGVAFEDIPLAEGVEFCTMGELKGNNLKSKCWLIYE